MTEFIFLGSKITVDCDCSHKIKRHLLLGIKTRIDLDSIKKQRHYFAHKGSYSQSYVFFQESCMYGCESWTIKKAEHGRIDVFKLCCWRRLLRVLWTARRSNLKGVNPEYSLEGLILTLKLQYSGYLMWRANSLEKTLMLGKIEGRRRRRQLRMRLLDGIINSIDMSLSKLREMWRTGKPSMLQSMFSKSWIRLSNWTTTKEKPTWYNCSLLRVYNSFSSEVLTFLNMEWSIMQHSQWILTYWNGFWWACDCEGSIQSL